LQSKGGDMCDIIRPHGGYAGLKVFQTAEIICDATVVFCRRFLDRRSRTNDQMAHAARSRNRKHGG